MIRKTVVGISGTKAPMKPRATQASPATPYTARQVNCTVCGMGSNVARKPTTQNSMMAARSRLRLTWRIRLIRHPWLGFEETGCSSCRQNTPGLRINLMHKYYVCIDLVNTVNIHHLERVHHVARCGGISAADRPSRQRRAARWLPLCTSQELSQGTPRQGKLLPMHPNVEVCTSYRERYSVTGSMLMVKRVISTRSGQPVVHHRHVRRSFFVAG